MIGPLAFSNSFATEVTESTEMLFSVSSAANSYGNANINPNNSTAATPNVTQT